jgi:hypothetical protein
MYVNTADGFMSTGILQLFKKDFSAGFRTALRAAGRGIPGESGVDLPPAGRCYPPILYLSENEKGKLLQMRFIHQKKGRKTAYALHRTDPESYDNLL